MVGLPKTPAGTHYLPDSRGDGWVRFEHDAGSEEEVYRRINLLFRNRKEEIWLVAGRSAYDLRRMISPMPRVAAYFLELHQLRKSVWAIINEGVTQGKDLSTISLGCRLHSTGYVGLLSRDINLWVVVHAYPME